MSVDDVPTEAVSVFYKWSCPLCEQVRGSRAEDAQAAAAEALRALQVHVRMSDDGDHGPRFQYPEAVVPDDLEAHVQVHDDR